jgi:hypothetical protein
LEGIIVCGDEGEISEFALERLSRGIQEYLPINIGKLWTRNPIGIY